MKYLDCCFSCPLYKITDHECLLKELCENKYLDLTVEQFNILELKTFMYKLAVIKGFENYKNMCFLIDKTPDDFENKLQNILKLSPLELQLKFSNQPGVI